MKHFIRYIKNISKLPVTFTEFCSKITYLDKRLIKATKIASYYYNPEFTKFQHALYVLTLLIGPDAIIETGVAEGYSSHAMLEALRFTPKSKLISVDLRTTESPDEIGSTVPQHLRTQWELIDGDSKIILPKIDNRPYKDKTIIVMHDSNHTYDHMKFELNEFCRFDPTIILCHDSAQNMALKEFAKSQQRPYYYMYGNLAGVRMV